MNGNSTIISKVSKLFKKIVAFGFFDKEKVFNDDSIYNSSKWFSNLSPLCFKIRNYPNSFNSCYSYIYLFILRNSVIVGHKYICNVLFFYINQIYIDLASVNMVLSQKEVGNWTKLTFFFFAGRLVVNVLTIERA